MALPGVSLSDRPAGAGAAPAPGGPRARESAALYLTMAGIVLMGFNTTRLADMPVSDVFFLAAAGMIAFNLLADRTGNLAPPLARRSSPPILMGTIVFLTAATISAYHSWDPNQSIMVVVRLAWVTLGWFWVVRSVTADRAALAKLLGAWRAMLLLNSTVAVLGHLHIAQWGGLHGNGNRQIGFFDQPNDFAGLLVVGLPLTLLGLPRAKDPSLAEGRELVARGWPSVLAVFAVATTGSMSAFVAAFAGGLTIVAALVITRPPRSRRRRSPLVPMVAALGVAVGVVTLASSDLPVVERFTGYSEGDQGVNSSVESRGDRNDEVIERFDQLLIVGEGFGGYNPTDEEATQAGGAHNMIMLTLFQAGLPGVVGLLVILLFTFRHGVRLVVNTRGTELHAVAVCLLASLVIVNTFAMFQPTLYHRYYWLPVALLGALWSLRRRELRDQISASADRGGARHRRPGPGFQANLGA